MTALPELLFQQITEFSPVTDLFIAIDDQGITVIMVDHQSAPYFIPYIIV